ncbi:MAG: VWA domain-containing protein [Acidobacteriaceae bacterium]|nr:VWA domain-containing protein [Acidobacteriaceae bacterium]
MWLRCLLPVALAVFCTSLDAQQSPAQGSRRVTLDVVVNDKSGDPVAGLQRQDFTVLDNKQPQKILSFASAGPESDLEIVLVLDAANTSFRHVAYARKELDTFLRQDGGRLARPTSMAIFTDTAGIEIQSPPSRNGNALAAYLDQHETGLRVSNRSQGLYGAADRAQFSLRALQQLAAYEQHRPGRKLVVWLSPGWALLSGPRFQYTAKDQESVYKTIVSISAQLRQARITLYAVDPLGTTDTGGLRTIYYENFLKPVTTQTQIQYGDLGLQVFAVHTGGRVLTSTNDIAGEIERCVLDANAYYVLSFDAPPAEHPNFYNSIEVKLSQPQLKARTLAGFYTQP